MGEKGENGRDVQADGGRELVLERETCGAASGFQNPVPKTLLVRSQP